MNNVNVNVLLNLALSGDNSDLATADLGTAKDSVSLSRGETYAHGSGSGQCDVIYHDILPVTTADKIDFNGVVLKDAYGVGLAMTKIKTLFIKNLTGGSLEISNDGANIFPMFKASTDTLILPNNSQLFTTWPGAGLTIGAATGKLEFVHAVGGAQNIEIIAAGVR